MTRLVRGGRTWLTYAQLGTYGYFLYGFGPALTQLRDEQGFSRTLAGLHGTALAVGALLSALCVAQLAQRFGRTAVLWAGLVLLCGGIVTLTTFTSAPLTLLGALACSFGGSFVVTCSTTVLSAVHGETGPAAITEANAVAAAVGAAAPLVVGVAVATGTGWRAALLLVLPAVAVMAVVGRRVAPVAHPVPVTTPDGGRPGRLSRRFWICWGVVAAGIAIEFCLALWAADMLHQRTDLSRAAAAGSVTALVAGMAIGRVVGGRLALRLPLDRLMYAGAAVNAAGFALFWSSPWGPAAVAGLLVSGLGLSVFFPLGLARAIAASDGRPDLATARTGLAAALASGAGPFVLGALADRAGIHAAMLVVPVLLVVVVAGVRLSAARQPMPLPA